MKNAISTLTGICLSVFVVAAQPASASDNTIASAAAAAQQRGEGEAASKGRASEKKYCAFLPPETGSRLSRKVCRTKSEWSVDGIDVDAKN